MRMHPLERSRTPLFLLGFLSTVLLAWPACSSGVTDTRTTQRPQATPSVFFGLGFDPGLPLTDPIEGDVAIAAASIPKIQSTRGRSVAFLAFTTRARADDGDGTGRPLVKSAGHVPTDTNDAPDVFLAVIENEERYVNGEAFPTAFDQALLPTFRDVRCERCHGFFTSGGFRESGHPRRDVSNPEACEGCHDPRLVFGSLAQANLTGVEWDAPPPELTFASKSDREVFDAAANFPGAVDHMKFDAKINWAIDGGVTPLDRIAEGGTVPIDGATWRAYLDAWDLGGRKFSSGSAVKDLLLVSQAGGAAIPRAADAGSSSPSITWESNPGFDPANPTLAPAGYVHVAFSSDATDIVPNSMHAARDVYRTRVTVSLNAVGRLELAFDGTQSELVSRVGAPTQGGDARSDHPVISRDGRFIAYESEASDLVVPFIDGNGADPDVYRYDVLAQSNELLSVSTLGNGTSGNAGAFSPSIVDDGSSVAFESGATDLVVGDSNAQRDVFVTTGAFGSLLVRRASVATGGGEGMGASSSSACAWRDPQSGDVFVAFESAAANLAFPFRGDLSLGNVYLHDLTNGVTTLVTRSAGRRGDEAGNGRSSAPAITLDGTRIVYASLATNLDTSRTIDANGAADVFAFDLARFRQNGALAHERLSIAASGQDANGVTQNPLATTLVDGSGSLTAESLVVCTTTAANLGRSANDDHVLFFLPDRTASVTVAEFTADAPTGSLENGMFTVTFEDLSVNATSWAWDLDGDGLIDSTQRNPQFTYTLEGTFTVSLSVMGPGGSDSNTRYDFVSVEPPSWTALYVDLSLDGCATSGCHDGMTAGCGGAVFSMVTEEDAYRAMVDVPSRHCDTNLIRVQPGSLPGSILDDVIKPGVNCPGCLSSRMGTLTPSEIARVEAWIAGGAPR